MENPAYVEIGYFEPLYERVVTVRTSDSVLFKNGTITFLAGGHSYEIATERIMYITPV